MFSLKNLLEFKIPLLILLGIILFLTLGYFHLDFWSNLVILLAIALGSYELFWESTISLMKRHFALDYIAILAIIVSVLTHEYLVGAVIALMIASGRTLEEYGTSRAKAALTNLADRIPDEVTLWVGNRADGKVKIEVVQIGQDILIKKGEVISLDGQLQSEAGLTDESSLTGEPYEIEKIKGDQIRSGTINIGNPIVIKVTKLAGQSTYNKIVSMVREAQEAKAPLIRLADKYSIIFTIITFAISAFAYIHSGGQLSRVLAVLVVATPCPLILATPIALIGGLNAAAKAKIIVKKLAALEVLSRANTLVFDKTGTITLGIPRVMNMEILNNDTSKKEILGIAESLERNSLHPLAKALVAYAKENDAPILPSEEIREKIGEGIFGTVKGRRYQLSKLRGEEGMAIELKEGSKTLAIFRFEDQIKDESKNIISGLEKIGYKLFIFTGDKKAAAQKLLDRLGQDISIRAELSPKDKQDGIRDLKQQGQTVAMVGDGINDAPALALSDVGMVFSNEEQTAASEAADIVFLGGNFSQVVHILQISKNTISIAMQSILWGIGLSIAAMVFASFGYLPPLFGAGLQEAIDVAVILNALRASKS